MISAAQGFPRVRAVAIQGLRGRAWQAGSMLLTTVAFGAIYARRLVEQSSNVDDYLYTRQTSAFLTGLEHGPKALAEAWRAFPTNSPLVPMLSMPMAGDASPHTLVVVQLPLLLGLLWTVAELLGQFGFATPMRWGAAAVIVCLPPLLSYSAMFHFGLASSLCVVATLVAYFASDRFRRRMPSVWLGVALGCLSLTRVVSPVYIVALVIPVALGQIVDWDDPKPRRLNALIAAGVALAIALPWWALCGPSAVRYLRTAGYSSGSGFTEDASILDNEIGRVTRTADESGWLVAVILALLFVVGFVLARRARRQSRQPQVVPSSGAHRRPTSPPAREVELTHGRVVFVGMVALLGMVMLGTSSNSGTAFALPYVVLVACVGVAALAFLQPAVRTGAAAALVALCLASVVALVAGVGAPSIDGRELWLSATPIRQQAVQALGCDCPQPDADALNDELVEQIGSRPTLVLRDDAIVNPESLRVTGLQSDETLDLRAPEGGETQLREELLDDVDFALSGRTSGPYHSVDLAEADAVLMSNGFRAVLTKQLSPNNVVVLWASGDSN